MLRSSRWGKRFRPVALGPALLALAMGLYVPVASAGPGYEPDAVKSSIPVSGQLPLGLAVDQASQNVYVAEVTTSLSSLQSGQVEQLNAAGIPTASSPFTNAGGETFFFAVAVNPVTQGVYAYQGVVTTPLGLKGSSVMNVFSSAGALQGSFNPASSNVTSIATDASGRVYYPNTAADSVQVFNSSGTLEATITCAGCPGGGFVTPNSVALDSAGNVYVVDRAGSARVVKFQPSGGGFAYHSVLQSGRGAVAVGVDPSSNDVFVGDYEEGSYHVVAYDSSGVQFDDFGAGLVGEPFGGEVVGQLAVNATTRDVYLSDPTGNRVLVFDRVASIPAPVATTTAPTSVGQQEAILNATVNPKGHGLTDCHFKYTDHADFLANGYANATSVPCPGLSGSYSSVPVSLHVSGLSPGTDYDYRLFATSNGGSAEGGDQAFETLPPLPPTVTTGTATSVTLSGATLGGTVNPKGGTVSDCHFEYTDAADFGANGFANALDKECLFPPEGTASVPVSAKVTGLTAGTDYRFRLVATNNSGTTEATEKAFTTVAETCQTNSALCPPPPEETPPATVPVPPPVITPPSTTPPRKPLRCRKGFKKKRVRGKVRCVKIKKRRRR
jgi:hypothetical protein